MNSFLDEIDRISAHNFTPTDDDILRVRIPTTGIVQEDFQFSHVKLRSVVLICRIISFLFLMIFFLLQNC